MTGLAHITPIGLHKRQVVSPRHQTPQGKPVAKPETPTDKLSPGENIYHTKWKSISSSIGSIIRNCNSGDKNIPVLPLGADLRSDTLTVARLEIWCYQWEQTWDLLLPLSADLGSSPTIGSRPWIWYYLVVKRYLEIWYRYWIGIGPVVSGIISSIVSGFEHIRGSGSVPIHGPETAPPQVPMAMTALQNSAHTHAEIPNRAQ